MFWDPANLLNPDLEFLIPYFFINSFPGHASTFFVTKFVLRDFHAQDF